MDQTPRFHETLRRLAIFDEAFVEAGLRFSPGKTSALEPTTAALLRVGSTLALGSSAACLGWSTTRALAAGATKDEIADVLLAIAPVVGLDRVVSAAPALATALEYDIEAAMHELNGY